MTAVRHAAWLSHTSQFFFGLLPWLPVFYERQLGLSDEQIFGIQSIYYFAFCLLEIPPAWSPTASTTGTAWWPAVSC